MNKNFIRIILILFFYGAVRATLGAQQENIPEDLPMDFDSIKNPFESKLPVIEKIQRPVEPSVQITDNKSLPVDMGMSRNMTQEMTAVHKVEFPQLSIKGIFCGTSRPLAIVDDQVVGLNDVVKGARVKSISKGKVRFVFRGEEFNVKMPE